MTFIEVTDWYSENHKILIRKDLIKGVMPLRGEDKVGSEIYLGDTLIRVNETYEELRNRLCGGEKK